MVSSVPNSLDEWRILFRDHLPGYDPFFKADDYEFCPETAARFCKVFSMLPLIEGEHAGKPFNLEPWQVAFVGCLYGWKSKRGRRKGLRRYSEAMLYVPRKNGKTMLVAGLVICAMFLDEEPGCQVYSAAAEREQAALVFRQASGMIARVPELAEIATVKRSYKAIEIEPINAIYKALSADADTKHGLGAHMAIVDELHAHPNADLVEVLQTSMGSRREPILVHITTADYQRVSICNQKYDYACKVRDQMVDDPGFLPCIYEASVEDDWTSEEVWEKANPNIDVSVSRDFLARECKRAQEEPTYENTFKRLHLNVRTQQNIRWLPIHDWDECAQQPVASGPCYGGLDLSTTGDITALVLYWPETKSLVPWFWVPNDNAKKREIRDSVPYLTWAKQELLELTDGNVVDYSRVRAQINKVCNLYDVQGIGYDPWNAQTLAQQLQDEDGLPVMEYRQGFGNMNEPSVLMEQMVAAHEMKHGGNPVMRWMAGNVAVRINGDGYIRPDKPKSTERIDGIVASIIAIGMSIKSEAEEEFNPGVF